MKEQIQQRLQSLKTEYEAGKQMMAELEAKQANLRDTLLRISGAIQVLEETLSETPADPTPDNGIIPADAPPIEVSAIFPGS